MILLIRDRIALRSRDDDLIAVQIMRHNVDLSNIDISILFDNRRDCHLILVGDGC